MLNLEVAELSSALFSLLVTCRFIVVSPGTVPTNLENLELSGNFVHFCTPGKVRECEIWPSNFL